MTTQNFANQEPLIDGVPNFDLAETDDQLTANAVSRGHVDAILRSMGIDVPGRATTVPVVPPFVHSTPSTHEAFDEPLDEQSISPEALRQAHQDYLSSSSEGQSHNQHS
jgi:hypothetical protein